MEVRGVNGAAGQVSGRTGKGQVESTGITRKSVAALYDAVAQGLAAIRGHEWAAAIAQGLNVVKVSVADVRVEHEVKLLRIRCKGPPPRRREVSDRTRGAF